MSLAEYASGTSGPSSSVLDTEAVKLDAGKSDFVMFLCTLSEAFHLIENFVVNNNNNNDIEE